MKGYKPGRKLLGDIANWDELDASQSIIVGSPETVYRRIWKIVEQAKVGNLLIQFHIGNMPDAITRKSMARFAAEVALRLREDSQRYFQGQFPQSGIEKVA